MTQSELYVTPFTRKDKQTNRLQCNCAESPSIQPTKLPCFLLVSSHERLKLFILPTACAHSWLSFITPPPSRSNAKQGVSLANKLGHEDRFMTHK